MELKEEPSQVRETQPETDPFAEVDNGNEDFDGFLDIDEFEDADDFYNETTEEKPKAAPYDPDFGKLASNVQEILREAQETVTEQQKEHPKFKYMYGQAEELKTVPLNSKRRINIVGKSGAGKSSLLNSVLGRADAAKALAAGKGCTHVPTSYESPFEGQVKPSAARVHFFSEDETRKKLELMLEGYSNWHFGEHDWAKDDDQQWEGAAQTAFDAFRSMFCDRKEFRTDEAGEAFLAKANEEGEDLIECFTAWCMELVLGPVKPERDDDEGAASSPFNQGHVQHFGDCNSQTELREEIESFCFSSSVLSSSSLWPLVKLVRIGMQNVSILEYATLVDWPGADDTNQLRANASAERVYDCDEIWIVSSAARICTEPTINGMLAKYGDVVSCTVVCTQIDANRDDELAAEMKRQGLDTQEHDQLLAREKDCRKSINSKQKTVDKLQDVERKGWVRTSGNKRQKMTEGSIVKTEAELRRLERELLGYKDELQQIEQRRLELIIAMRKSYITAELESADQARSKKGPRAQVFFVSNEHYMALKGAKVVHGPRLSPESTGIPALRRHILEAAAPEIVKTMQNYMYHKVEVLMGGLALSIDPGGLKGCKEALEMVAEKKSRLSPFRDGYLEGVRELVETELVDPFMEDLESFQEAALDRLKEKKRWHWVTIRAFVRNGGNWKTKSVEYQSWNNQFLEAAATFLEEQWKDFLREEKELFQLLQDKLADECRDVLAQVGGTSAQYHLPRDRFQAFIEGQINGAVNKCVKSQTEFTKSMGFIKINATQADAENPTAYFVDAMKESWAQASAISGTGMKDKILTTFECHLKLNESRSPFALVVQEMKKAVVALAETQTEALIEEIKEIFETTRKWLEAIFQEDVDDDDSRAVCERLKPWLPQAQQKFSDVKSMLETIEKRYH